ncbi:hypothetical protein MKW94_012593 [Papaver nudicaule]|uniref:D-aminoacyl-tRNA deacylase n=1 Tax=Papaver nudicaule TaxID=74823 RepID=A0AA41S8M4_PAPNU|nr:hypothetical protein [Papaver nudicaule]
MQVLKKCKSEALEIEFEQSLVIRDNNNDTNDDRISDQNHENQNHEITPYQKRAYKTRKNAGKPRNVRQIHRERLTCLLKKLMLLHRWEEANGVLSVLLQGTERDRSPAANRFKYWAALELQYRGDGRMRNDFKVQRDDVDWMKNNEQRIKRIYAIWSVKNGQMKSWSAKEKYLFQIEFFLYRLTILTRGRREVQTKKDNIRNAELEKVFRDAKMTITHLVNKKDFESEPIANIVVGLIYYELWYMSSTLKEMRLRKFDMYERPAVSEISGMNSFNEFENLDSQNSVDVGNAESTVQRGSGTSSMYKKRHNMDIDPLREETKNPSQEQGFYTEESSGVIDTEELPSHNQGGNTSIFYSRGLQTSLLPLRLPNPSENVEEYIDSHRGMVNEDYDKAVKHLKCALYSTPPVLASLLPLVQLLLLGDQVEAALEELEKICERTDSELPYRLWANLLEGFDGTNAEVLSSCYENILLKDPACSHAVNNLISLYKNGDYSLELLVEMIALHLDVTDGSCTVWEELASCFLKVSQIEDILESTNSNAQGCGVTNLGISSTVAKRITDVQDGRSSSLWKLRRKLWVEHHFKDFFSEMPAGDWNLFTFKAACASHLYGPEFEYVRKVSLRINTKRSGPFTTTTSRRNSQIRSMRAVVQRVASASVEIGPGLLVLVGIHESDIESDADYICRKVLNMRLFTNDKTGKAWDQNVMQKNYGVLLVSQFTLYGMLKGNKPDFHYAMPPLSAKPFYASLVDKFRNSYNPDSIKDGVFGAMMKVNLINDGPVTMQLDSPPRTSKNTSETAEG